MSSNSKRYCDHQLLSTLWR